MLPLKNNLDWLVCAWFRRQELIEILDEHCRKANASRSEPRSEYDFVYLPIDYGYATKPSSSILISCDASAYNLLVIIVRWCASGTVPLVCLTRKKANKGYAFVNFTTTEAAIRMWREFNGFKWEGFRWKNLSYRSKKICKICAATVQVK